MNLKLKSEYEGMIITRSFIGVGQVTFDANKILPDKYENYLKMGFSDLFDEITVCPDCNNITCSCEEKLEAEKQVDDYAENKKKKSGRPSVKDFLNK